MSSESIVKRKALRASFCRGCDKKVVVGEDIVYTYSFRNRGQNIIFCMKCAEDIGNLTNKKEA